MITQRSFRFMEANQRSPIVYYSAHGAGCTYRLANGQSFNLSANEARSVRHLRWQHLEEAA